MQISGAAHSSEQADAETDAARDVASNQQQP
jgi:hypothetical protein